jgi:PKD repeat protein
LTPPIANFTVNTTSGTAPLAVQFTDTSTGAPTSWSWTFGDGGTSTEQSPVHAYSKKGAYTVSLRVVNSQGVDVETRPGAVTVVKRDDKPVASFTWAEPAVAGVPVQFTDTSAGEITHWDWKIGWSAYSVQNPVHTFSMPGEYQVTLRVRGSKGWSKPFEQKVRVRAQDIPLTASFSASPVSGKTPLSVRFTDASTGGPVSWFWSFGDGKQSRDQSPKHVYQKAGTYTVNLTVTDAARRTATVTRTALVTVTGKM